jgi:serine/threonine-protein kinase
MAANAAGAGKSVPREPSAQPPKSAKPAAQKTASVGSTAANAVPDSGAGAKPAPSKGHGLDGLKQLGRYTIIKKLGQGGMGTVFLANDTQLRRQVALKVLPKEKAENPTLVKRFKAEAQAAAALKHDNIVAIHDAGEADGLLYIALEFVDGTDAHTIVAKRGPMPAKRAMDIIRQTALALQHAYQQKIVHRDIKPSNLLIRKDGLVKLADMGLARSVDESLETNITRAGTTVGTVDYMSPEQARNSKAADIRSDMYSLGATWFHLLTGHAPFPEGSMLNKLNAHSGGPRPDVRDENDSVSENVSVMIKRLMAIKPEDRYQNPSELIEDLDNENLTRGPMSLKDLAALAEEDDADDSVNEPKATYKKPAAQEAKQLAAPTQELPVQKLPTAQTASTGGINLGALKTLGIGAAVIAVLAALGYIASQYGGAVGPSTTPGSNPFDRSTDTTAATSSSTNVASGDDKKPKPATPGTQKGPKPIGTNDVAKTTTTKPNATVPVTAGAFYFPPIAPLGRDGEVKHLPEWIAEAGAPAAASLKRVAVGGGPSGFEQVATLEQALKDLPAGGGVVELVTDGPYFLSPTQLTNRATIVLRAANGTTPVVVLVADPDQPYDALLQVTNGALTLEGLQVLVDARQFANADPLTLISVRSGDFAAVRCAFTLLGRRPGKTFAFAADGRVQRADPKQTSHPRLLVRDTVVRGEGLGGFNLDQTQTDLVASRCVFATGAAPLVHLTNREPPVDETPPPKPAVGGAKSTASAPNAPDEKKPGGPKSLKPASSGATTKSAPVSLARRLRFLSCTLLTSGTAFELAPGADVAKPPTTEILIANSVLAGVSAPQAAPVLLALPGWQQALLPANDQSPYPNLQWQIESSVVCGWQKLILEEPGATKIVRDGAAWKEIWRNQALLDPSQFQTASWPKTAPADLAALSANDLGLPTELGLKASDGQTPGCPLTDFATPTPLTLARADALTDRARYPIAGIEPFVAVKTIDVDAGTQDLGKVLGLGDWPSGTLVIVSGQGPAEMTPVEVKNKSLRIEFRHTGEAPLVFGPRKSTKSDKDEAMFVVENGSLELVDGQFRFPNTSSSPMPGHFLSVHDGNFALRRCQVFGQTLDGTSGFQGLIRWKRIEVEPRDLHTPPERNSGVITDSALLTSGKLLDSDLRNRTLLLRNSLFASIGDLFDLNVQGFHARVGGTLDARWCTFGAGGKFLFQVRGTKEAEKAVQPLHVFLQHCVMLSLTELSKASASPVLLSVRDHVLTNQQLGWWDHGNGYSAPWTQFLRPAETPAGGPQTFESQWRKHWGDVQVMNTLVSNGDVKLNKKLPHRAEIAPRDFLLASDCRAATWGPNQTPIGVDFDRWTTNLEAPSRATGAPTKTVEPTKPATKKTPPLPSNKAVKSVKPDF